METQALDIANSRLSQWKDAIDQELQELMKQAGALRKGIDTAKTNTKRVYLGKKFKKVTTSILQILTALERIKAQQASVSAAQEVSPVVV